MRAACLRLLTAALLALAAVSQALVEDGYAVDEASDGQEGLAKSLTWPYDLIVLDIMLPEVDGLSILRQVRARQPFIPVLMLTALSQTHDKVEGFNAGADDYLTKPFEIEEMLVRVRALLRRAP